VKLAKIVLLSHQSKIASQVDLYSYYPSFGNSVSSTKYKRLGKFSLDDNSKSNFQARESKSVYLDTECQYLKFGFSQCHLNKYNIFNQVSVQSIKCYGNIQKQSKRKSVATNNEYISVGSPSNNEKGSASNKIRQFYDERNMLGKQLDSKETSFIGLYFDDKLKSLKKQEEKALYDDNFDQLKKIRTVMKSIMKAQKKLIKLNTQKIQAINNEDYETAQMVKIEMSKIQKTIIISNDRHTAMAPTFKGRGATLSPIEYRNVPNISRNEKGSATEAYGINTASQKNLNPLSLKTIIKKNDLQLDDNDIFAPKSRIGLEERALPALGRNKPIDFSKVNENEFEHQKPDQLNASKITLKVDKKFGAIFEKVSSVFGDELAKKVCADKWYFQQEGIDSAVNDLLTHLQSSNDTDKTFIIGLLADI
jgi:hypothetical protein